MNIHNFTNRQLCEYQSIFPTVASLLDHLLFTNGNGYDFDSKRGMIYGIKGKSRAYIDEYPEMTDEQWDALIADCHAKERKFHEQYARACGVDLGQLAEDCTKYKRVSVTASMFSEDDLYQQLCSMGDERKKEAADRDGYPSFVRPYPMSPGYAEIFRLSKRTPEWFLQIALNLCNAWVRFLNNEIETGNVWVKPSLRPATTESQLAKSAAMAELFDSIKEDKDYDGWLDKDRAESDYADLSWTTKHRDVLVCQSQRISELIEKS
jgi:hypothetical protein